MRAAQHRPDHLLQYATMPVGSTASTRHCCEPDDQNIVILALLSKGGTSASHTYAPPRVPEEAGGGVSVGCPARTGQTVAGPPPGPAIRACGWLPRRARS